MRNVACLSPRDFPEKACLVNYTHSPLCNLSYNKVGVFVCVLAMFVIRNRLPASYVRGEKKMRVIFRKVDVLSRLNDISDSCVKLFLIEKFFQVRMEKISFFSSLLLLKVIIKDTRVKDQWTDAMMDFYVSRDNSKIVFHDVEKKSSLREPRERLEIG